MMIPEYVLLLKRHKPKRVYVRFFKQQCPECDRTYVKEFMWRVRYSDYVTQPDHGHKFYCECCVQSANQALAAITDTLEEDIKRLEEQSR
jgi:hypothetical protein